MRLPTEAEAKRHYETLSTAYDHLVRNVLLPELRKQPAEYAEAIAKLEASP